MQEVSLVDKLISLLRLLLIQILQIVLVVKLSFRVSPLFLMELTVIMPPRILLFNVAIPVRLLPMENSPVMLHLRN